MATNKIARICKGAILLNASKMIKRDSRIWLCGEWFGKRCGDNVACFANYVAQNHPEIHLYWIVREGTDTQVLDPSIRVLLMDSDEADEIISTVGVVIMGQGLGDFSSRGYNLFGNALTVNLWHGVPWKKIGHGERTKKLLLFRIYTKIYDSIFSPECFMVTSDEFQKIVFEAYSIKPENAIKCGQPRNEQLYKKEVVSKYRKELIEYLGLEDEVSIVAYLPTFRDTQQTTFSFTQLQNNSKFLDILEKHHAVVIQKAHFVNNQRNQGTQEESSNRIIILNDWDCQKLLAAADLLVTDYSGAYFDYLVLDRPIVHYLYDYDYYKNHDRGLYFGKEDVVGGSVAENTFELIDALELNLDNPQMYSDLRRQRLQKYMTYESQNNCERLFREIISRLKK